ncbi:MAG TPA: carboxy terminal-processing peptidase [Spirochaetota bacterium]|nr:carboxy terminal-processing peptidase [Spirochaetota bacterium]
MFNKKRKITLIAITVIAFVFGCFSRTDGVKQTDIKPLVGVFLSKHVRYQSLDQELSRKTMSNLLNFIDPGKFYFYKSDVAGFITHENKLGEYIESGKYGIVFEIFALYKKRFDESMTLFNDLLALDYDFNKDEYVAVDREKIDYPASPSEMRERWRKNIKLQLLNYLTTVKDVNEAKEKLRNKNRLSKKRVDEINESKMISTFVNAFSTALDPHSNYLSQEDHEDFMIQTKLKLEGIGVILRSEDGFALVESIIPGGAAAKLPTALQLKPNDKIVAVAQKDSESVDVIDMDLRDVVNLIRGKSGTTVKLTIFRKADESQKPVRMQIPIVREEIKLEDRAAKSDIYIMKKDGREIKIGYIKLPTFYLDFDAAQKNDPAGKSSSIDVIREINKLSNLNIGAMVVDLRGNPGGALTEAVNVAGLFIDQGPVVKIVYNTRRMEVLSDDDPGIYYDGPLVVLIDRFSASASEIFAGAIKDYRRGIVLGPTATFGKGSVQEYNQLPSKKGAVKITTALFYQPGGTSNQLTGIAPDIIIPDISAAWDIGEAKLRNPLTWEKIPSASFVPYRNYLNREIIGALQEQSKRRVAGMKEFADLNERIASLKKLLATKEISLKEESNIEKHKVRDMEKQLKRENNDKVIDINNDLFLGEAFNITAEYIERIQ